MENYLTVQTQDGPMSVFMAAPAHGPHPHPVVIVLQEAFGVNAHIKDICGRFAQAGYVAMAPELFHREGKHLHFEYSDKTGFLSQMEKLSNKSLLEDVRETMNFLHSLPDVDKKNVFTVGFCMGGFTSLLAATELTLRGAVAFYGAGVVHAREGIGYRPFLEKLPHVRCPLLLFYGEEDVSIPEADRHAMRAVLDEAHVPHEMIVFGGADHGFFCDERKVFDPKAASVAWKKTLSWMESLKSSL